MENKLNIELLAKACDVLPDIIEIHAENKYPSPSLSVTQALTALQTLETALTEKHRAEVEKFRVYLDHKDNCHLKKSPFGKSDVCTCGLETLLTTNPKEERK